MITIPKDRKRTKPFRLVLLLGLTLLLFLLILSRYGAIAAAVMRITG